MIYSFTQLIDNAIKKDNEREHISSGKWKPSSFGFCYRRQYWSRKGEQETNPPDARVHRIFKSGKIFHDWVQGLLGDTIQSEVIVETDNVKGYADCVNSEMVIDIKTVHSGSFHYMTNSDDIKKDKYHNFLQVMWYAMELKKRYGEICFISKDDLCIQEYRFEVEGYWKDEVLREISTLELFWIKNKLPNPKPRLFISIKSPCKECEIYCPYLNKCYKLQNKELPKKKGD